MKQQQRTQAKKITYQIQQQIKKIFSKHKRTVDRMNDEKKFGGPAHKNDKSEKLFAELAEISKELKLIEKKVHQLDKLKKQRRDLYEQKTRNFNQALIDLIRHKNIRVKINSHFQQLVAKSMLTVNQIHKILKSFQEQSDKFFGQCYGLKPTVEKLFLQLCQLGFLWANIEKFDSVTNQSVKELYLPVAYDPADFQNLENQLVKLWPQPKEIQRVVYQKPVQQIIQYKSELQLAHQLCFGFTRPKQIHKAISIYQKQANKENSDPIALNSLGRLYQQGKEVPKDRNKAFKYYFNSAKKGDAQGLYRVGQYLQKGGLNFKQHFQGLYSNRQGQIRGGIEYYQKAAAKSHLDAITDLGFIYEKGITSNEGTEWIIEPHIDHAKKYYEKAKKMEFPRALNNLGNLLVGQINDSVDHNTSIQKGFKYLEKAVQMNYPKAYVSLGRCYMTGTGTNINIEKARGLFKQGGDLGDVQARLQYIRSYIGVDLKEEQIMIDLANAARLVLLENKDHAQALYIMGLFQEKGIGTNQNKQASFYYIKAAACLQYPPALTRLGDYYYSGYFVDKNYQTARLLYQKSGQKGDSQALLNLALMHQNGVLNNDNSIDQAQKLYNKAQKMGNTTASLLRGLKKQGNLPKNQVIKQAAEQGNIKALRLLNRNQKSYINNMKTKEEDLKKLSTFYMKDSNLKRY